MNEKKPHDIIYLTQEGEADEDSWLWCEDSVGDNDIKYIRADLCETLPKAQLGNDRGDK